MTDSLQLTAANLVLLASSLWIAGLALPFLLGDKTNDRLMAFIMLAGSLLTIAGAAVAWNSPEHFNLLHWIKFGLTRADCRIDQLSVPFLSLLGLLGSASAIASPSYTAQLGGQGRRNHYWKLSFIFLIGLLYVIISENGICFLVFWEVMSLACVALLASDHVKHRVQHAAFVYLAATRTSTAFFTAAFLWMHQLTGSWNLSDWHFDNHHTIPAAVLVLLGVCTKAGIWPMHVWLPYSYPEVPAPTSVLMCGIMSKLAMLVLLRLLVCGHCTSVTIACIAIALGTISAVWGVLFALMERDLKRILAYSSVENMGLILMAIGLSMLAGARGLTMVQDVATAAALFHIINHAIFKALLFLGASSVERSVHTRDLALLGGIAKAMPWTMLCFFVGAVSICAMPPLNGFASKWLLYQSFFRLSFEHAPLIERAVAMGMVGTLAFVGALSLAAYTKAVGIAFLGRPRSAAASRAKESKDHNPDGLIFSQILLACACVTIGTSVPIVLDYLTPALTQLTHHPGLVGSQLFPLPQGELSLIGALTVALVYLFVLGRKSADIRSYITWDCGFGPTSARAEETGSSFSHPIGRIFSQVLQLRVTTEITGKDRRHFPESVKVATNMTPIVETNLYKPAMQVLNWLSSSLARMQTGSIHIHLLYVFLTMILLVFLGTHI
ncbi:MAG: hypothetical protein JSS86_13540 [Cyanobacteria bacterium SZAS LIN-2]|nr:hypothetical protein [Cyanobacteria bacterium SZAS LIN-2]